MNNAVRFVTGAGRRVSSRTLMYEVNCLNIRKMTRLHTTVMAWKTINLGTSQHLADNISPGPDLKIFTTAPRLINTGNSLRWKMCENWNCLPLEMKQINSLPRLKNRVKTWIRTLRSPIPPNPGPPPGPPPAPPQIADT